MDGCRGAWLSVLLLLAPPPVPAAEADGGPRRFAVLVGIDEYAAPVRPLAGAENDVDAMREVLVGRWGQDPARMRVLKGVDANRLGVLNAVTGVLGESKPGDEVFLFFAGHGTSAADPMLGAGLPHTTGALVPSDFGATPESIADALIVGRRDLRPLLEALDRGGRRVFVAIDACYSGNTVRGRFLDALGRPPLPSRSADPIAARLKGAKPAGDAREPYPYRNVVYLSAAAEHEVAGDIPADYLRWYPTRDGKPHGAFTDALLRALHGELPGADRDRDGRMSHAELHAAVSAFMATRGYPQTPQLLPAAVEGPGWAAAAPVFGAAAPASAATEVAVAGGAGSLRLVGFDAAARTELLAGSGLRDDDAAALALVRVAGAVHLVSAAGDRIATSGDGSGRDLVALVRRRAALDALAATASRSGSVWLTASAGAPGGTFVAGESVSLSARIERGGRLVLLNLDPAGRLNLLYPLFAAERRELPAERLLRLDGSSVVEPFGHDVVYAFVLADDAALPLDFAAPAGLDVGTWTTALQAAGLRAGGSLVLFTSARR
jgi:hypothetical protein